MRGALQLAAFALLAYAVSSPEFAQEAPAPLSVLQEAMQTTAAPARNADLPVAPAPSAVQLLTAFKDSDVKFDIGDLMDLLRDRKHEGWVLAAYPDPKTGQPLIGAGFSLDLPEREHPQRDPLNPHPFLEPSSADLWQAAGLDPARLKDILGQFNDRLASLGMRKFRKKIRTLEPQIAGDEATLLLRVGAIQAIYNARAYCRYFDDLTASQQMAMSQLVYQMGVNLEEFSQFLSLINTGSEAGTSGALQLRASVAADAAYWKSVQQSLIHSQWARLYRVRALSVIAMLDPDYSADPRMAERRVGLTMRPAVLHRWRSRGGAMRNVASNRDHAQHPAHRRTARSRTRRTA